jgi:hypothetical protein
MYHYQENVLADPLKVVHGIQGSAEHSLSTSVLRLRAL